MRCVSARRPGSQAQVMRLPEGSAGGRGGLGGAGEGAGTQSTPPSSIRGLASAWGPCRAHQDLPAFVLRLQELVCPPTMAVGSVSAAQPRSWALTP